MVWVNIFKPNEHRDTWLVYAVVAAATRGDSRGSVSGQVPDLRRQFDVDRFIGRREFPADQQMQAEQYANGLVCNYGQSHLIRG